VAYHHPVSEITWSEHAHSDPSNTARVTLAGRDIRLVAGEDRQARRGPPVTYVIAEPCVDLLDKACIEECPVDCIYEGNRMLYIHPDECVDCGACEPVCPVEAIFYEDDLPEHWKEFHAANVEFFDDIGSPGGASKSGKIAKDHPFVAAMAPREQGH
jgi:ferredoxin